MKVFNKGLGKEKTQELPAENFEPEKIPLNTVANEVDHMPLEPPTEGSLPSMTEPPAKVVDLKDTENEETLMVTLEKLREEINELKLEKTRVIESEEKLRLKIESEIETKKRNIDGLKSEIPILKQRCEKLANILQIPVCK